MNNNKKYPVIAIDGPAGSGKSSVATLVAEKYGFYQIDSGAFYRTFTLMALDFAAENKLDLPEALQHDRFKDYLGRQKFEVSFDGQGKQTILLNEGSVESAIREVRITENIGVIADNREIRTEVNRRLARVAVDFAVVADGRDMGTVVFPDADIKFFITASLQERAKRRFLEFEQKQPGIELAEVEKQIAIRDRQDENREFGGLKQASDAIFIDTTTQDLKGVLKIIDKNLHKNGSGLLLNFISKK